MFVVVVVEVEREKQQCDELLTLSTGDRTSLDQNMKRLEQENIELQRQLDSLQTQLTHAEHSHNNQSVNKHTQTHRHTDIHTHRHTQTRRHTDTQTYTYIDIHIHTDTQTYRHTDTDIHRHRHTDKDTH